MIEDAIRGSLRSKLAAMYMARKEVAAWHTAYEDSVAEHSRSGFLKHSIKEGKPFPDFVLLSVEGKLVFLASHLEYGPVIISFFRGEWCPFCRLMVTALAEVLPQIEAARAGLLALTPETGDFRSPQHIMKNRALKFSRISRCESHSTEGGAIGHKSTQTAPVSKSSAIHGATRGRGELFKVLSSGQSTRSLRSVASNVWFAIQLWCSGNQMSSHEVEDKERNLVGLLIEREMASVQ